MITWFDSEWELSRGVAERSNAAVLKTVLLKGNGGSNPSSSAIVTIRKNDGTDAKYEMETFETQQKCGWETNRTDVTILFPKNMI
jgi:hypothetical protein